MTSFCRLIVFDKRGGGLSDRDVADSTLEERMDDLRAVLDAVGSDRAAVLGFSRAAASRCCSRPATRNASKRSSCSGPFLAFTRPRVSRRRKIAVPASAVASIADGEWGEGKTLGYISPSLAHVPAAVEFMGASNVQRSVRGLHSRP
jgi:hypothetical protein